MLSFFVKFVTVWLPERRLHKRDVTKAPGLHGNRPALPHSRLDWQGLVITHGCYPPAPAYYPPAGVLSARTEVLESLLPYYYAC